MSAGHDDGSSLITIGIGTLPPAALSAIVGSMVAGSSWEPVSGGSTLLFAGGVIGLVMGIGVAWVMAWNASVVGILPDRPAATMAWGVVPGALFGASLGAVFAGAAGLLFGHLFSAAVFGLTFGPVIGVIAWELAFLAGNFFAGRHAEEH